MQEKIQDRFRGCNRNALLARLVSVSRMRKDQSHPAIVWVQNFVGTSNETKLIPRKKQLCSRL